MSRIWICVILFFTGVVGCTFLEDIHKKLVAAPNMPPPPYTYLENGVFVSVSAGNDANAGTNRTQPVKTIQVALDKAAAYGLTNIYIQIGTYRPGGGLNSTGNGVVISNSDMCLIGGFNASFTAQRVGYSILDGTNNLALIIRILNATNTYLEGLIVCNGTGGGQILSPSNTIVDVVFSNNNTSRGLVLSGDYNNVLNCVFCFNRGTGYAGGLDVTGSRNIISGTFYTNGYPNATWGGAVRLSGSSNALSGTFSNNYSSYYGGAIVIMGANNIVTNSLIRNNYARRDGGGIRFYESSFGLISNSTISHNLVNYISNYGSAIFLQLGGTNRVVDCLLVSNRSVGNTVVGGGCIDINGSVFSQILNCVITNNYSGDMDAVISLNRYDNNIISLVISNNILGGTNASRSSGIYEYNGILADKTIVDNRFVSNSIGYLYWRGPIWGVVTNGADWTNINRAAFLGAAIATNNTNY